MLGATYPNVRGDCNAPRPRPERRPGPAVAAVGALVERAGSLEDRVEDPRRGWIRHQRQQEVERRKLRPRSAAVGALLKRAEVGHVEEGSGRRRVGGHQGDARGGVERLERPAGAGVVRDENSDRNSRVDGAVMGRIDRQARDGGVLPGDERRRGRPGCGAVVADEHSVRDARGVQRAGGARIDGDSGHCVIGQAPARSLPGGAGVGALEQASELGCGVDHPRVHGIGGQRHDGPAIRPRRGPQADAGGRRQGRTGEPDRRRQEARPEARRTASAANAFRVRVLPRVRHGGLRRPAAAQA